MEIDQGFAELIGRIHNSGRKAVIEFAGAGSVGLAWLHGVAGSSRLLLEATDRYSSPSMADLLGAMPEKFVSQATAEGMAERANQRAMVGSHGAPGCRGVACTATIATDRVKRGEHGCWVAVQDSQSVTAYGLVLEKGARDRAGEEQLVSRLLVHGIATAAGASRLDAAALGLGPSEQLDVERSERADVLARLLAGEIERLLVLPDGTRTADQEICGGILSGSFHPLHAGHEQLAQAASVALAAPVTFEIPVINADKPPLGYAEVARRLEQFAGRYAVLLSRAPRFVDKAALYPRCTFVLGFDTAERLLDARFYEGPHGVADALRAIGAQGCRFLVAGRMRDGVFHTLAELAVPPEFAGLFQPLPETLFRSDLSSTAIRAQQRP
jgi:hypothetical protein